MRPLLLILGLCIAAALVVVETPGLRQPLFLVGLGLTFAAALVGARASIALVVFFSLCVTFTASHGGLADLFTGLAENPRRLARDTALYFELATLIGGTLLLGLSIFGSAEPRRTTLRIADDYDAVVTRIGDLASYLFLPLTVVIIFDITQRKLVGFNPGLMDSPLHVSSTKLQELEWHIHSVLFMLALGLTYLRGGHVRIELVRDLLSEKMQTWIEAIGLLLLLIPYCWIISKLGYHFAERALLTGEVSSAQTGLSHRWIIKAVLPFGMVVLGLAGLSRLLRCFVSLFARPDDSNGTTAANLSGPAAENEGARP